MRTNYSEICEKNCNLEVEMLVIRPGRSGASDFWVFGWRGTKPVRVILNFGSGSVF